MTSFLGRGRSRALDSLESLRPFAIRRNRRASGPVPTTGWSGGTSQRPTHPWRHSLGRHSLSGGRVGPHGPTTRLVLLHQRKGRLSGRRAHGLPHDRDTEGRPGLPQEGVQLGFGIRGGDGRTHRCPDRTGSRRDLRDRCLPVRPCRIRGYDGGDHGQCPHDGGSQGRSRPRPPDRLPGRSSHGLHGCWFGPPRPHVRVCALRVGPRGRRRLRGRDRLRTGRIVNRPVLPRRGRHLHQGS